MAEQEKTEMPVKRDPRGTFPKTVTYTVEDPDGYDYTVGWLNGKLASDPVELHCFAHGTSCAHAAAVKAAIDAKKVKGL